MPDSKIREPAFSFDYGVRPMRPGDPGYVEHSSWMQRTSDGSGRFTCGEHLAISGDRDEVQRLASDHLRTAHGIKLP